RPRTRDRRLPRIHPRCGGVHGPGEGCVHHTRPVRRGCRGGVRRRRMVEAAGGRAARRPAQEGDPSMTKPSERIARRLPRAAVVVHDLAMVWIAWTGLHLVRYALRSEPSPLAQWSPETALVLLAQG